VKNCNTGVFPGGSYHDMFGMIVQRTVPAVHLPTGCLFACPTLIAATRTPTRHEKRISAFHSDYWTLLPSNSTASSVEN